MKCLLIFFLMLILSSCGVDLSSIRHCWIIVDKHYVLDSIVLYEEERRISKYDSVNRNRVKEEKIYFGLNDSLTSYVTFDSSVCRVMSGNYHFVKKMQYCIDQDTLFLRINSSEKRRLELNSDSTKMILDNETIIGTDRCYYSLKRR